MTDGFTPPIKERSTAELLEIVGASEKWNPQAVRLATNELKNRNISQEKIQTAKYLSREVDKAEKQNMADESYHLLDFVLRPAGTLLEIIFSWELKKDGYIKKAKQQKYIRFALLILALLSAFFS